jgi:hypothetical protein
LFRAVAMGDSLARLALADLMDEEGDIGWADWIRTGNFVEWLTPDHLTAREPLTSVRANTRLYYDWRAGFMAVARPMMDELIEDGFRIFDRWPIKEVVVSGTVPMIRQTGFGWLCGGFWRGSTCRIPADIFSQLGGGYTDVVAGRGDVWKVYVTLDEATTALDSAIKTLASKWLGRTVG